MKSNTVVLPFICGLVCLGLVLAIPMDTLLQAEILEHHACILKGGSKTAGAVGCTSGAVGPSAPCTGSVVEFEKDQVCEDRGAEFIFECTVVKLKKTEYFGVAKGQGLVKKAACFGVPLACLGCAIATVVAGAASAGGGYVIGAGLCSAIGCVGTVFFNPSECCYTECFVSKTGHKSDWKDGCNRW